MNSSADSKDSKQRAIDRTREWRAANLERSKEYFREYHKRTYDPAKARARALRWERNNPEKAMFGTARRRAKKYGVYPLRTCK